MGTVRMIPGILRMSLSKNPEKSPKCLFQIGTPEKSPKCVFKIGTQLRGSDAMITQLKNTIYL